MADKKDCFAYRDNKSCAATTETECSHCAFYKTKARLEQERSEAKERIKTLASEQQSSIADKYGNK